MMNVRQLYETTDTRKKEERVKDFLVEHWGLKYGKHLTMAYGLDYALVKHAPEVHLFCEIKVRSPRIWYGFGDGYYLSLQKMIKARHLFDETHKQCCLAVNFEKDDSVWVTSVFRYIPGYFIVAGREDRPDEHDLEPEVVYPWDVFERLR